MVTLHLPKKIVLEGDKARAATHIGEADSLLNMVEIQAGFQKLNQHQLRRHLHDGTLVAASVSFGQGQVRIFSPSPETKKQRDEKDDQIEWNEPWHFFYYCGEDYGSDYWLENWIKARWRQLDHYRHEYLGQSRNGIAFYMHTREAYLRMYFYNAWYGWYWGWWYHRWGSGFTRCLPNYKVDKVPDAWEHFKDSIEGLEDDLSYRWGYGWWWWGWYNERWHHSNSHTASIDCPNYQSEDRTRVDWDGGGYYTIDDTRTVDFAVTDDDVTEIRDNTSEHRVYGSDYWVKKHKTKVICSRDDNGDLSVITGSGSSIITSSYSTYWDWRFTYELEQMEDIIWELPNDIVHEFPLWKKAHPKAVIVHPYYSKGTYHQQ